MSPIFSSFNSLNLSKTCDLCILKKQWRYFAAVLLKQIFTKNRLKRSHLWVLLLDFGPFLVRSPLDGGLLGLEYCERNAGAWSKTWPSFVNSFVSWTQHHNIDILKEENSNLLNSLLLIITPLTSCRGSSGRIWTPLQGRWGKWPFSADFCVLNRWTTTRIWIAQIYFWKTLISTIFINTIFMAFTYLLNEVSWLCTFRSEPLVHVCCFQGTFVNCRRSYDLRQPKIQSFAHCRHLTRTTRIPFVFFVII